MQKNQPLISIIGTTSVGKSECAFLLAAEYSKKYEKVFIISVDSKQVYKGLEILTGADIPKGFVRTHDDALSTHDFFVHENIYLFGLSCIKVSEDWSVSHFKKYAEQILSFAYAEKIPVILVGGTGLYHQHLFSTDPVLDIPPNYALRETFTGFTAEELYTKLLQSAPDLAAALNDSDKYNPRRLIRAIERAHATKNSEFAATSDSHSQPPQLIIGLQRAVETLPLRIKQRVEMRIQTGALIEVSAALLEKPTALVQDIIGFKQCAQLLAGELSQEKCISAWALADFQYAKRQNTWWKKNSQVQWIDRETKDWFENVLTYIHMYSFAC